MWNRISPRTVSKARGRCRGEDGNQRHLDRDDEQPDDHEEQPVAPGELEPGEGVAGERRDHDREDRPAERDPRVVTIEVVICSLSKIS